MAYETRVALKGSERKPVAGAKDTGSVAQDQQIEVTVVFKRRQQSTAAAATVVSNALSREDYGIVNGADENALNAVEEFAHEFGLTVSERNQNRRSVTLSGPAGAMQQAFGTKLSNFELTGTHGTGTGTTGTGTGSHSATSLSTSGGGSSATSSSTGSSGNSISFRGRTGSLMIPQELESSVLAVLGLDNRPAAKPHFRRKTSQSTAGAFTPLQLAQLYNFPAGVDGAGQTIGIIELGGGYRTSDLRSYFRQLHIQEPKISAVSVNGGHNQPGGDADGEVMLDIEVAGAIAPGSKIVVYFARNTDQGFHNAIAAAAHDTVHQPSIISISWGGSENHWTEQATNAMNAALEDAAGMGVTVTVACGDDGATDGSSDNSLQVDFPSSSPFVLACGGTKLTASGTAIGSETVWNDLSTGNGATGGGVSRIFQRPQFQNNANVPNHKQTNQPGRGVPDVSGDADPFTGYVVKVDGQDTVIGGTSAVAPLWAGLVALINQQLGKPLGFANPLLYQASLAFHDVSTGSNGSNNSTGYTSGKGWDACTGLGSPNGVALVKALQSARAAKTT